MRLSAPNAQFRISAAPVGPLGACAPRLSKPLSTRHKPLTCQWRLYPTGSAISADHSFTSKQSIGSPAQARGAPGRSAHRARRASRSFVLPGRSPIALRAAAIALSFPCWRAHLARQCSLKKSRKWLVVVTDDRASRPPEITAIARCSSCVARWSRYFSMAGNQSFSRPVCLMRSAPGKILVTDEPSRDGMPTLNLR